MHGRVVDRYTAAALLVAERRLGYELTITQGSYNDGGVAASGGTHDGGGVVDLAAYDYRKKVLVLRYLGFAAWYRPELWKNGKRVWPAHIHAVQIGNRRLSPEAQRQVAAYKAGRDGLAANGPDNGPRVGIEVFRYRWWLISRPWLRRALAALPRA